MEPSKKKVLVCPLHWGLGHASRCIPIIEELIKEDFEVIIGASGKVYEYLKTFFPRVTYIKVPYFLIKYWKKNVFLGLLFQVPKIILLTLFEHFALKNILKKISISIIISDNRYGLWNKKVYSILITHQLYIRLPKPLRILQKTLWKITKAATLNFNECWVPDLANAKNSLSGELSHGRSIAPNVKYIGILSRFAKFRKKTGPLLSKGYELLVILSGPEPQRTILENIIITQANKSKIITLVIRGLPGKDNKHIAKDSVTLLNLVNDNDFFELLSTSDNIICRSGYSTIMDLISMNKMALLIPTPGQTEQEYLAERLSQQGLFLYLPQQKFDLPYALKLIKNMKKKQFKNAFFENHLYKAVLDIKARVSKQF